MLDNAEYYMVKVTSEGQEIIPATRFFYIWS